MPSSVSSSSSSSSTSAEYFSLQSRLVPSQYQLDLQFFSSGSNAVLDTFAGKVTLLYNIPEYLERKQQALHDELDLKMQQQLLVGKKRSKMHRSTSSSAYTLNLNDEASQTFILNSATNCTIQNVMVKQNGKKLSCKFKEKLSNGSDGETSPTTAPGGSKKSKKRQSGQRKEKKKLKKLAKKMNMKKSEIIRVAEKDLIIHVPELDVYSTRLEIEIRYTGEVQHKAVQGCFTCGPSDSVITTLFEPRFARTVFPCIDEIEFRALFELSVTVPHSSAWKRKVLSNWPIKSIKDQSSSHGTKTFEFKNTTVQIPTYLMAFTIGDYIQLGDDVHCTTHENQYIPVKFYGLTTSANKLDPDFFLAPLMFAMKRFEVLFGLDIELPKMDLVVVPAMALGGMEHHGSIFLAEAAALIPEGSAYDSQRDELVELIIHEVGHYFVGNITGLPFWVKEGLAQYYELHLADEFLNRRSMHPKLKIRSGGDAHHMSKGSGKDAVAEAGFLFTNVTYDNSLQLILSMERALGKDEFRSRIAQLVRDHIGEYITEQLFLETVSPL